METNLEYKCYNCGKLFRDEYNYNRHKNRKLPCLIKDLKPEDRKKPNRCIYCNRIFTTKGNLQRHYNTCKVKNGGMDVLVDKVIQDQKIKELEEKLAEERAERQQLAKQVEDLRKSMVDKTSNQINNGVINNGTINNIEQQIIICPYKQPNTEKVKITVEDISKNSNLPQLLFERIYFNINIPENHCLHLSNKKEHCLLYHEDGRWKTVSGLDNVERKIKEISCEVITGELGSELLNGNNGPYDGSDSKFLELPGAIKDTIIEFNSKHPVLDRGSAYDAMLMNKYVTADTRKKTNCPALK